MRRYVILADPANNSVLAGVKVSLLEAESAGYERRGMADMLPALPAPTEASSKVGVGICVCVGGV